MSTVRPTVPEVHCSLYVVCTSENRLNPHHNTSSSQLGEADMLCYKVALAAFFGCVPVLLVVGELPVGTDGPTNLLSFSTIFLILAKDHMVSGQAKK